jgi:predicted outer membrane repeat protein
MRNTSRINTAIVAIVVFAAIIGLRADTITVTNTNDSGPGSLRQALVDANDGDTIDFAVTGTIGLTSSELLVTKSITISGPGAENLSVDGNATNRVFHIGSGKTVAISGVTVTNGSAFGDPFSGDDSGGGIYNDHATLTLSNCAISDNSAFTFGGGVYNDHATLMVNNCALSGNFADNTGGGIYNDASNGSGSVVMNQTTLIKNSAFSGGAIFNSGESGTAMLELTASILSGNSASNSGGGIGNLAGGAGKGGSAILQITDSTLTNNTADGDGGAIYSTDSFDIDANATVEIASSTLSENSTTSNGGGIYSLATAGSVNVHISNSTLSGNSASGNGGGVGNVGGFGTATMDVHNTTFFRNSAQSSGGNIHNGGMFGTGAIVSLTNIILEATKAGGNISNDSGMITSLGYNLSSDDGGGFLTGLGDQINTESLLGPLLNNGGLTFTHALLPGSPAINTGDPSFTPPPFFDQRGSGFDRVVNGRIDIGSFEVQTAGPTPTPSTTPTATPLPTSTPTPTATPRVTPRPRPVPHPRPTPP